MGYAAPGRIQWTVRERAGIRDDACHAGSDVDAIEALADRIALLAAQITASKHELLTLIAEFDGTRGWAAGGHRDCAHWLSFRTGMSLGTAREHVRVAVALQELPQTRAAMARGALSFCKARAITRVARPETEGDLLPLAEGATTAQVERMVRAWKLSSRLEEEEVERQRFLSRSCSIYPEGGMYVLVARLPADEGAMLRSAIDVETDAIYREQRTANGVEEDDTRTAAARRRADALVRLVSHGTTAPAADDETAPVSGMRAAHYEVVLHVEPETLRADGEPGMSELEDGTRIPCETARRVACDAGLVRMIRDADGSILDVGRRTRTIPPALRRALETRDRGCRFPGCGLRYAEAHHVTHWADGGETSLKNTVLLCRFHHRLVHEDGWALDWWNERGGRRRVAFTDPCGQIHLGGAGPKPPELPADVVAAPGEALAARNRANGGPAPDAWTASARWKRDRDIPDAVYFRATEAGLG